MYSDRVTLYFSVAHDLYAGPDPDYNRPTDAHPSLPSVMVGKGGHLLASRGAADPQTIRMVCGSAAPILSHINTDPGHGSSTWGGVCVDVRRTHARWVHL